MGQELWEPLLASLAWSIFVLNTAGIGLCGAESVISHEGVMSLPFLWLGLFVVHYSGDETRNDKQNGNRIRNESFWVYYDPPLTFELSSLWALGVWTCWEQACLTCVLVNLFRASWCGKA